MLEKMVGVKEVSAALQVSIRTIWRLQDLGDLPRGRKIGRQVRWRESDIAAYLAK